MGDKGIRAIEQDEKKYRKLIIEEESDSKDEEENEALTCLGCAVMKAMDDALIHGELIYPK
jgi:hypothetical protein